MKEGAVHVVKSGPTPAKILSRKRAQAFARIQANHQRDRGTMAGTTLTKKQLKAAQFRSKGKGREEAVEETGAAAGQDVGQTSRGEGTDAGEGDDKVASKGSHGEATGEKREKRRKRKEVDDDEASTTAATVADEKKRKRSGAKDDVASSKKKRTSDDAKDGAPKSKKKRFTDDGQVEEVEAAEDTKTGDAETASEDKKEDKRYIIFVGNMSYQSTAEQIAKHFSSHCHETPSVRLLTTKGDPKKLAQLPKSKQKSIAKGKAADPSAPTSKGCAFLEFTAASALQKALQFHHTQFEGRTINVELTAGGGGKGDGRKERIRKKNQDLEVERQKLHDKYVKGGKKDKADAKGAVEAKMAEEPAKPAWGPRAAAAKGRTVAKIPKWAVSGANAVRLSG